MITPGEVKFALERKLLSLAENGRVPLIMGVHSVVVEGNTVHVGYDIVPDPIGNGVLFFEFERPQLVSRDDVRDFTAWLAWSDNVVTIH
jgi:hypothetical protein